MKFLVAYPMTTKHYASVFYSDDETGYQLVYYEDYKQVVIRRGPMSFTRMLENRLCVEVNRWETIAYIPFDCQDESDDPIDWASVDHIALMTEHLL